MYCILTLIIYLFSESSCPRLRSPSYSGLVAFNCFVCTQQEGFMYHFPVEDGEVVNII